MGGCNSEVFSKEEVGGRGCSGLHEMSLAGWLAGGAGLAVERVNLVAPATTQSLKFILVPAMLGTE